MRPDLDILLVQLQDGRSAVRIKAAQTLAKHPDKFARKPLLMALKDKQPEVRFYCVQALEPLLDGPTLQELISLLQDPSRLVRLTTLQVIGRQTSKVAFQPILEMLGDPEPDVRALTALYLSRYPDSVFGRIFDELDSSIWMKRQTVFKTALLAGAKCHKALLQALNKPDSGKEKLFWLIKITGELRLRQAAPLIVKYLKHGDEDVLQGALKALGKLGVGDSVPFLLPFLEHKSEKVREACIEGLGDLGEYAVTFLVKKLDDDSRLIRFGSASTLAKIQDVAIGPLLDRFYQHDQEGRYWVLNALKRLKTPLAHSIFKSLSQEDDQDIAVLSIAALSEFEPDEDTLEILLELLDHEHWKIRNETAKTLASLNIEAEFFITNLSLGNHNRRYWMIRIMEEKGWERFIPSLLQVFRQNDWVLKASAADALQKIPYKPIELFYPLLQSEDENEVYWATKSLLGVEQRDFVEPLLKCLRFAQSGIRDNVKHILKEMGDTAFPRLRQVFRERWPRQVYNLAAEVLSHTSAREHVFDLLRSENKEEIYWGSLIASSIGPAILKELLLLLQHQDWRVRYNTLSALRQIRSKEAIPALLDVLEDEYWSIRKMAIIALGDCGDGKVIAYLTPFLDSEDLEVRLSVLEALGKIGSEEGFEVLKQALNDESWLVVRQALRSIGRIAKPDFIPSLLDLSSKVMPEIMEDYLHCIHALKASALTPWLLKKLNTSSEVLPQILACLGVCGGDFDPLHLIEYLDHPEWNTRKEAIDALGNLGAKSCIPQLKERLSKVDPVLRIHLREALKKVLGEATWEKLLNEHVETTKGEQAEKFFEAATELARKKEWKKVQSNLAKALALHEKTKYLQLRARAYAEMRDFEKAEKTFLKLLQKNPDDHKTMCNLAMLHLVQGNTARVENILKRIEEKFPAIEEVQSFLLKTRERIRTDSPPQKD